MKRRQLSLTESFFPDKRLSKSNDQESDGQTKTGQAEESQSIEFAVDASTDDSVVEDDASTLTLGRKHSHRSCQDQNCTTISKLEQARLMPLADRFQHNWIMDKTLTYSEEVDMWWLIYEQGVGMFCSLCQKHDTMNPKNRQKKWNTEPSVRYKRSQMNVHRNSQQHQLAISAELNQRVSVFHKETLKKNKVRDEVLLNAFLSAYWLAKEETSNRKLPSLLKLLEIAGLHDMKFFTHRSQRSIREIFLTIGQTIQEQILQSVKNTSAHGLLVDEVTDIAVTEQMLMFVQYVDDDTKVQTKFLAVRDVLKDSVSPDAECLHDVITNTLEAFSLEEQNLTSLVTDGASVMVGKKSGVATRLKQSTNSRMLSFHCICHRLALASSDSADEICYLKDIEELLLCCWKFFENSPKRSAAYAKVQQELHSLSLSESAKEIVTKKLKKATRTRWLSLNSAITGIYQDYVALVQTFRSLQKDATAAGLLQKVNNVKFLGAVYILRSVLPPLASLSKAFQKGSVHFTSIIPSLQYTLDTLDEIMTLKLCVGQLKHDLSSSGRLTFCGLEMSTFQENQMITLLTNYITALKGNISARFSENLDVISAFQIFDPCTVPLRTDPDFSTYGNEDCNKLATHFFLTTEDQQEVFAEWTKFKYELLKWQSRMPSTELKHNLTRETSTEWAMKQLLRNRRAYNSVFPKLSYIAEVCLSMPVSNAWPERGASALKRLKTRLRNRL